MTTKQFTGGATIDSNQIRVQLRIGGQSHVRTYNTIDHSITRLLIITKALSKITLESTADVKFFIEQLAILFRSTNISLLPNIGLYQISHNICILDTYIRACMQPFLIEEAIQLLNYNRIIRELESDTSCSIQLIDTNKPSKQIISHNILCEFSDGHILRIATKLKDILNQYVQMINSKKIELESACTKMVKQIDQTLA